MAQALTTPHAKIRGISRHTVAIICPYCGQIHRHQLRNVREHQPTRLAPACGMRRTGQQRAIGYIIDLQGEKSA